jgi:AAA domain-containing protein
MNHQFAPATYEEQELPQYRYNPFIECLPPIRSTETLAEMMRHDVPYDPSQRFLRNEVRRHAVQAVKQFYAPMPRHVTFAETFSSMLRSGYESRNPVNPIYWTGLKAQRATLSSHLNVKQQTGPITLGTAIVGPSGIGKSLAVDNTLKLYPQVVQHTSYRGEPFPFLQLTWLKLACPFSGSIKGLTQNFFHSVDRRLGTSYARLYVGSKTAIEMMPHIATVGVFHGLGCLIIDEIQHLKSAPSGGIEVMLNFFVEMENTMQIPIILIGTPKAVDVLTSEFRSARRASGQGAMYWDRMGNDACWRLLCQRMWTLQYTKTEVPLTDEIIAALHDLTQGIPELATILYKTAQETVIGEQEAVTIEVLRETSQEYFKLVHPFLSKLRGQNKSNLVMADLEWPSFVQLEKDIADKRAETHIGIAEVKTGPIEKKPLEESTSKKSKRSKPGQREAMAFTCGPLGALELAKREKRKVYDVLKEQGLILNVDHLFPEDRTT